MTLRALLGAAILIASGCSQSVVVKTDRPARVMLGESVASDNASDGEARDDGFVDVDASGVELEVPYGFGDVPYRVEVDGTTHEGTLERTQLGLTPVIAGCGLAACTAPTCAACGTLLVNPQLALALPGAFLTVELTYATCAYFVIAPTWTTSAAQCLGCSLGLGPLALLGMGALPDEVTLPLPAPAQAPPGASDPAGEMEY